MSAEDLEDARAALESQLLVAAEHLDHATDCVTCAEAAAHLSSVAAAAIVVSKVNKIAAQEFRFGIEREYLVIRDLARALDVANTVLEAGNPGAR
jgi:hypothetical protein